MTIPAMPPTAAVTWQDWALAVLSGTVGSVIALGGLVGVYLLTQRSERKRAAEIRRSESVGQLLIAAEMIVNARQGRLRTGYGPKADASSQFSQALVRFAAREFREHPDVARWAIDWAEPFSGAATLMREGTPREREDAARQPTRWAAQVNASLLLWLEDPEYSSFPAVSDPPVSVDEPGS